MARLGAVVDPSTLDGPAAGDGIDAAYEDHPLAEADEWGDLESFHTAAGASQVHLPSPD